ncbi:MAG: hypothetical protein KDH96_02035 [Candidatus Riesia sp.]|nr:hypothetical protein [Candidatus Riesia sp.]
MRIGKQDIPSRKVKAPQRLVVMNPNKGLNSLVSPSLIDNREFSDLLNVEYDEGGVIRKRNGYVAKGGVLTAAKGLGYYKTESLNQLVTVDGTGLKYYASGSWNSATGDTFSSGYDTSFTQARLKLYIWNGVDGGAEFNGTAVTRPGTMPKAKFSVYYQNKHIASGVPGQPSRLYISNLTNASDFTVTTGGTQPQPDNTTDAENGITNVPGATVFSGTPALTEANVIDVRKNDGDAITGLAIYQDVLIVFKERSIYQLTFDSSGNPTVIPITYATGCVSHRSIAYVENDVYFMSREGHRVLGNEPQFFTAIRTQVLSIRVQQEVDSMNMAYISRGNSIYFDNKWIFAHPTGTSSSITKCLVYDKRFQAYTIWTNFNAQAMVKYIDDTTNQQSLFFMDDSGTQMYQVEAGTYNDDGSAISAYVISKAQDLGQPDITKFWVDLRLIFRRLNGQATLTVYKDSGIEVGTATLSNNGSRGMGRVAMGTLIMGTDGLSSTESTGSFTDEPVPIGLNTDSRTIKFKISNDRLDENFVLLGVVYMYHLKSPYLIDTSRKVYL